VEEIQRTDSAVDPPVPKDEGQPEPAVMLQPDLDLASASAALLFAVVPIVLGVFAIATPDAPPTAVVLAVGGASLITALALGIAARRRLLGLSELFAADLWAVALIALVVAFSGRYHSPYVELYLLAVVHAAAFQPRVRVISLVLAAMLTYLVPAAAITGLATADVADAVIPSLTITLAAGVIYAAAERLRRQRDAWAEREAAMLMLHARWRRHPRRRTVGADKAYDTHGLVEVLRELEVTPHVAQNLNRRGGSAIDVRTTRHPGYAKSLHARPRIEPAFGWLKTIAWIRKVKRRGLAKVDWLFRFASAAFNLRRLVTLMAVPA